MPRYISIIIFLIITLPTCVRAQIFSVANPRMNIFYAGIENDVSIVVENTPCKSLTVKTTNGTISGEGCSYKITPSQLGIACIIVYKKSKDTLVEIGRTNFKVYRYDKILLHLDIGKENMKANEIAEQKGVHLYQPGLDIDFEGIFTIEKFYIRIIYADSTKSASFENIGDTLQKDVIESFRTLRVGDKVQFKDIVIITKTGFKMELDPVYVTIIP